MLCFDNTGYNNDLIKLHRSCIASNILRLREASVQLSDSDEKEADYIKKIYRK